MLGEMFEFIQPKIKGFCIEHFLSKEKLFSCTPFVLLIKSSAMSHTHERFIFIPSHPGSSGPHKTEDAVKDTGVVPSR